ncbi:MAG: oligosaccharide flippase family protein [Nitrospiraceae bacterium]
MSHARQEQTAVGAPPRLRQRIVEAGGWMTAGFVLDKLIATGQLVILARLLTPADLGQVAASAVVLLTVLTVSEMGVESALVARREVGEADLAVAWTLALGRALVLGGCVWVLAGPIATFFRASELDGLLRVHSLVLLLQGLQSPALALLLRNLDLGRRVRLDLVRRSIEAGATIGLALWLRSAWAVIGGQLIGFAFNSVLSYWVAPFRPRLSLDRKLLQPFLQYGKHLNLTTILIFGVTSGGEYVIGRLLGTAALGVYQVALALPTLIGTRLPLMVNRISFPAYVLLDRDRRAAVRVFGLQFGVMGLLLLPLSAVLALGAPDVVGLLAGEQWREAAEPLRALALFTLCCGLSVVMGSLHYGLNHPEFQTRIWMVQFLIYAALLVPFTMRLGLTGAAWALSLSSAIGFALHLLYTRRLLGSEAWTAFGMLARAAVPVAALAGLGLVALWFQAWPKTPWDAAVWLCASAGLYGFYLWRVEYPRLAELWHG